MATSDIEIAEHALQHHFADMDQQKETSTFGMWLFLVTEIMFFGGLFCAYLIYRSTYYSAFRRRQPDHEHLAGSDQHGGADLQFPVDGAGRALRADQQDQDDGRSAADHHRLRIRLPGNQGSRVPRALDPSPVPRTKFPVRGRRGDRASVRKMFRFTFRFTGR